MELYKFLQEITLHTTENMILLLLPLVLTSNLRFIREHKLKALLFIILQTFFLTLLRQILPLGVHTIFTIAFYFILLHTLLRYSAFTCIITVVSSIVLTSVTELLVMNALSLFLKSNFSHVLSMPHYRFLGGLLCRIIQFTAIYVLYRTNIRLNKYKIFQEKSSLTTSAIFLQSLIMCLLLTVLYNSEQFNMIMLVYLMILSLNVFSLVEREKMLDVEKKYVAEREHVKNMEVIIDVIRKEKHEFANQLNTLTALCLLEKENKEVIIEEYAKKLLSNIHSTYRFYESGNIYVDGLLAVKSNFAAENNIVLDVDFDAPLSQVDIDDIDLTSIMGNIIDNALDAIKYSSSCKKGIVSIYTYVDFENTRYFISISNNGDKIPDQYMNKIFENRFSTKKHIAGTERGYGLYITKQLLDKHRGNVSVTSRDDMTEFLLSFCLKKEAVSQSLCS